MTHTTLRSSFPPLSLRPSSPSVLPFFCPPSSPFPSSPPLFFLAGKQTEWVHEVLALGMNVKAIADLSTKPNGGEQLQVLHCFCVVVAAVGADVLMAGRGKSCVPFALVLVLVVLVVLVPLGCCFVKWALLLKSSVVAVCGFFGFGRSLGWLGVLARQCKTADSAKKLPAHKILLYVVILAPMMSCVCFEDAFLFACVFLFVFFFLRSSESQAPQNCTNNTPPRNTNTARSFVVPNHHRFSSPLFLLYLSHSICSQPITTASHLFRLCSSFLSRSFPLSCSTPPSPLLLSLASSIHSLEFLWQERARKT